MKKIFDFLKKHKFEIIIVLVTVIYLSFIGQKVQVDGRSMEPTFHDGQYIYANKTTRITKDYERYDVIVFHPLGTGNVFIKRIIGLPGETVKIDSEGNIFINDELLTEPNAFERMTENVDIEMVLEDDEYFVLGDNRNHSCDSRYSQVGPVKEKYIIGRCVWKKKL